jgi:hypothetical protein
METLYINIFKAGHTRLYTLVKRLSTTLCGTYGE